MSDVDEWDPTASKLTPMHRKLLERAAGNLEADDLGLSTADQAVLRPIMQLDRDAWHLFCSDVDDDDVVDWIKVITLLESRLSGFECDAKSPVIALVRELKNRGSYPPELTAWVKSNTTNRFLPYGSLLDRL